MAGMDYGLRAIVGYSQTLLSNSMLYYNVNTRVYFAVNATTRQWHFMITK